MTTPAQLPPPSRKRRIIAAALCPLLGTTPLIALDAIGQPELTPISPHALWAYVGAPIFVMYAMAIPAIPAFWLLAMWSNASDRAWVSVPLLAAIFTLTSAVTIGSFEPAGLGFFFATLGLPIAVAYGLLVGAPWRVRRAEAARKPLGPA